MKKDYLLYRRSFSLVIGKKASLQPVTNNDGLKLISKGLLRMYASFAKVIQNNIKKHF